MGESGAGRAGLTHEAWSRLHHDIDPAQVPLLRPWLRGVDRFARPLHFLPPIVITAAGAIAALGALFVPPWAALALVVVAVGCDALDGAVAALTDRATRAGAAADKIADRIADTAFALVIWRCGAPLWLALVAAGLALTHEGVRTARGGAALAAITVNERPSRVICTVLACGCAGLSDATWPATICAGVWVALAAVGLVQVSRA